MGLNEIVDFSTAKLLKEKGFDKPTPKYFRYDGKECENKPINWNEDVGFFSRPTIADVIMWLYEKHSIFITVTIPYSEFGKFSAEIWGKESANIKILLVDGMSVFNTINQAYEEGIIESLKLI